MESSKVVQELADQRALQYAGDDEGVPQQCQSAVRDDGERGEETEEKALETTAEEEKPIVALEKERSVCMVQDDDYHVDDEDDHLDDKQHMGHHHHQQLSSLSDLLVSRHSIDSLDQECGHTAEDPDDGNYPGSCLSAEDSGIHTEDMSSCVSQADDEERSNLQPSPVLTQQQQQQQQPPSNVIVQQNADDMPYNMVRIVKAQCCKAVNGRADHFLLSNAIALTHVFK